MATKPSRLQTNARDDLADALNLISRANRLDGRGLLGSAAFAEIGGRVARVSSAFSSEEIVARALERRALGLGLAAGTAEMLTLAITDLKPLDVLLLDDEAFRGVAAALDKELGDM